MVPGQGCSDGRCNTLPRALPLGALILMPDMSTPCIAWVLACADRWRASSSSSASDLSCGRVCSAPSSIYEHDRMLSRLPCSSATNCTPAMVCHILPAQQSRALQQPRQWSLTLLTV